MIQKHVWNLRMETIEARFHRSLRFAEKRARPEIHRRYQRELQEIVDEMRGA